MGVWVAAPLVTNGSSASPWRLIHPVIFCAWCGRVRFAGHWFGKPRDLEVVAHARRQATSGICPSCFAELELGREYEAYLARQAGKAEDRMQLDCVRGDARLAMLEIEERDADDARLRAEPQLHACFAHLPALIRRRPARTRRRGRLRDHVVGARLEDEVKILVRLVPDERHGGIHAEDMTLEGKPCRGIGVGRSWVTNCAIGIEWTRSRRGRFCRVSPSSARRRRRAQPSSGSGWLRWRGDAGYDERDPDDTGDGDSAHTHETGTTGDDIEAPMLPPRHGKKFWGLGQD